VLNSGVTGFCFKWKSSDDLASFFLVATKDNWRPSQKFVLQHHWKICTKIPPYAHCKSPYVAHYEVLLITIPSYISYKIIVL